MVGRWTVDPLRAASTVHVRSSSQRDLYLYDFRTGRTSKVAYCSGLFSPRWSPDGRYIAAMTINHQFLTVIDLKTGGQRKLEHTAIRHPFWSVDSEWVYFNSGEPMSLWRYRAHDGHLEQVPMHVDPLHCSPWMANGMRLDGAVLVSCYHTNRDIYALDWK